MINTAQYFINNYKQKQKAMSEKNTEIKLAETMNGKSEPEIDPKALYFIDFSKLQRLEDLILILASIGFSFSPTHPHFHLIKPFMNLENPILPNGVPVKREIKLPKLKKVK